MAHPKRQFVLTARLISALAVAGLRGPVRRLAWWSHDFWWLYPTMRRNAQWHGPVATTFATEEREVWVTIDDGPDPLNTPDILDVLAQYQAKATFFVIGEKVESQRPLVRRIVQEGHSLGNHTYHHYAGAWWALPGACVRREMAWTQAALKAAVGTEAEYFRSPVGMNNRFVHPAAARLGLRVVGWSACGHDGGCPKTPSAIVSSILPAVRPGAIILLHEAGQARHRAQTLARLLEALTADGYRCVLPSPATLH